MPSKKPQFIIRSENKELFKKMSHIAKINKRSTSQEIVYLCEQEIKNYESKHGEIILDDMQQC